MSVPCQTGGSSCRLSRMAWDRGSSAAAKREEVHELLRSAANAGNPLPAAPGLSPAAVRRRDVVRGAAAGRQRSRFPALGGGVCRRARSPVAGRACGRLAGSRARSRRAGSGDRLHDGSPAAGGSRPGRVSPPRRGGRARRAAAATGRVRSVAGGGTGAGDRARPVRLHPARRPGLASRIAARGRASLVLRAGGAREPHRPPRAGRRRLSRRGGSGPSAPRGARTVGVPRSRRVSSPPAGLAPRPRGRDVRPSRNGRSAAADPAALARGANGAAAGRPRSCERIAGRRAGEARFAPDL